MKSTFRRAEGMNGAFGGVCGLFLGLLVVEPRNLNPFKVDWLLAGSDATAHQLSFEFFRRSPLIQWPITSTPTYIEGSGQVLASANALFAIPTKLASLAITTPIQFYGLQLVLAFALLGLFSEKLFRLGITDPVVSRISVLFVLMSPVFLYRLGLSHFELGSHFLIVWALYLLAAQDFRARKWSVLMATTSLTSVYLAVMILILFLFGSLENLVHLYRRNPVRRIAVKAGRNLGLPIVSLVCGLMIAGYGSWIGSAKGSGIFRLNFLAFVNPKTSWGSFSPLFSSISPFGQRDFASQEVEGFGFIGIAPVILLPFALLASWFRRAPHPLFHKSTIVSASLMFAYAITNRVSVVRREFSYYWPNGLLDLQEVFRSAARFSWPLYYLLVFVIIYRGSSMFRSTKIKRSFFLLVFLISAIDSSSSIAQVNSLLNDKQPIVSRFQDPQWSTILRGKSSIEVFPTFDVLEEVDSTTLDKFRTLWPDIAILALRNNVGTNFGLVPRSVSDYVIERNAINKEALSSANLEPDKVYLIVESEATTVNWTKLRANFRLVFLDGYWVVSSRN